MSFIKEFRYACFYGSILAMLIFILKWMQWKFLIDDLRIEIYTGMVALFFTILGIWITNQFAKQKNNILIIEKEIPENSLIDKNELQKLNLSNREYEVLKLLTKGYSNADIADHLFLSVSTIKTHVSNLLLKMNVKSRTQAIEKAKRLKIVE
ncbi:response regulator transcription factor [Pedobacter sp.]|uniref:response regulator transcription factor n=1 Tax=Pedobacter sp. TaxID=1411316 RepID=UPI00396CB7DB